MPDETVIEAPTTPEAEAPAADPSDDIRGIIFGTEEERAEILARTEEPSSAGVEPKAPKKPKAKKDSPVPAAEEGGESATPPEESAPGKPKPPKKLSAEETARLHAEVTREAVVSGVREAVAESRRPAPEPSAPKADPSKAKLPAAIRRNMPALAVLEQARPEEFKDLTAKVVAFYDEETGELAKYRKAWKKEHPGEEFDQFDDEHADWMSEHEPFVSDEDLEEAKEVVVRQRMREEVQNEMAPLRRQLAEREAEATSAPVIQTEVNTSLRELATHLNPALKDLKDEDINNLQKSDPVAHVVIQKTAPTFVPMIAETVRVFAGKPYDQRNPVHVQLNQYAMDLEANIARQDPDKTVIQGPGGLLRFATRAQLAAMPANQRGRFWSVNRDVIIQALRRDWNHATAASYKEYQDLLTQLNGGKPLSGSGPKSGQPTSQRTAAPKPAPAPEDTEEEEETPVRSPSFRSSSPAPPPGSTNDPALKKPGDDFFQSQGW